MSLQPSPPKPPAMVHAIRGNKLQEVSPDEVDFQLPSSNAFFGSHINLIPLQNAVQGPRLFYGARFYNQAMPVRGAEAPLVQNRPDDDERSFDEILGAHAGVFRAQKPGIVKKIAKGVIHLAHDDGEEVRVPVYQQFPFNRKSSIHSTPTVNVGDKIAAGQVLAHSNFTDKNGTLAMGLNARVGLVPYKGYSMDDAVVISEDFAKRLTSEHLHSFDQEFDNDVRGGKNHFVSLFPEKFKTKQLALLDDDGVVLPGTTVRKGDPLVLATKPRAISSASAQLGRLSKRLRDARADASQFWDNDNEGVVVDVVKGRDGTHVNVQAYHPTEVGDKIVLRSGQKGVVSKIIPTDQVPRTADGRPLDVLLNPLGIPSRVNSSLIYELLLGKVAEKNGAPFKLKGFNQKGEKWFDLVKAELDKAGLGETEEIYDPVLNRKLENPVTVGNGYLLKLHHTAESKSSARGTGSYDANQQPARGGGEFAQSKRLSGLETGGLLSAGAYATLREAATLRGQRNDSYWRELRSGYKPRPPGSPFVWDKFQALLSGAGIRARAHDKGKLRLGPFTDKDLEAMQPVDVENGEMVDLNTLDPKKGGLFDPSMVASAKWGRVRLPMPIPNPAFEDSIRKLLGLTEKQMRAILAGEMELPEELR